VNTANPGPRLSDHWPVGQHSPKRCTRAKPDSAACAFDYGFNAAKDSFVRARAAARLVGAKEVARSVWWLDVETHNTWESLEYGERPKLLRNDAAVLAGATRLLHKRGVRTVGVYSTMHQWLRITGGATLDRAPVWYAGLGTRASARKRCRPAYSFTGGKVRMAQYAHNGFDGDLRC
jgi:GH25 family lysozyme M1 (1,4-beta-N-acetylmuramidase)